MKRHGYRERDYAFAPEGRTLASSGNDGTVRIWDGKLGMPLKTLPHPGPVFALAWQPQGRLLASAGSDRLVTIWDMAARRPPRLLHGHPWFVFGIAWSPEGRVLASSGWDETVRLLESLPLWGHPRSAWQGRARVVGEGRLLARDGRGASGLQRACSR